MKGIKIEWTEEMVKYLKRKYPTEITAEIARHLKVSPRSVVRKARELGIDKVEDFHQINAGKIARKISKAHKGKQNSGCFKKGTDVGKEYRFQKGHQLTDEQRQKKSETAKRNWHYNHTKRSRNKAMKTWRETWLNDAMRFTYGLKQETKFHFRYNALREYRERNENSGDKSQQ